jgi:hypothetical protein
MSWSHPAGLFPNETPKQWVPLKMTMWDPVYGTGPTEAVEYEDPEATDVVDDESPGECADEVGEGVILTTRAHPSNQQACMTLHRGSAYSISLQAHGESSVLGRLLALLSFPFKWVFFGHAEL